MAAVSPNHGSRESGAAVRTLAGAQPVAESETGTESIDALAFATDAASERALAEGLSHLADAQAWGGGLRAAAEAMRQGHGAPLVFVDLDGVAYPAGAIYELSAVCEEGTAVVAFGEDASATRCREVLLAGVREYLVKPLSASAVREAAERAAGAGNDAPQGTLVGFTGTGGTGATTLAAASALLAAERGRYVSVLDLNRACPAVALSLDVEPASGLVDLLGASARASLNPEMVERVGARRSGRITVYAYPPSADPAPPLAPVWAVCELLVELQRRSHLVVVDGMDDPRLAQALLALVDVRVLVVEPTASGAAAAARTVARLGPMLGAGWPSVLVQNHTRAFDPASGARALARAGLRAEPGVVVPFEPALPAFATRGMPERGLPRALRAPLAGLAQRLIALGAAAEAGEASAPAAAPARKRRARSSRPSGGRARRSSLAVALRGLFTPGAARPQPVRGG